MTWRTFLLLWKDLAAFHIVKVNAGRRSAAGRLGVAWRSYSADP
jgi:hypothetical protein